MRGSLINEDLTVKRLSAQWRFVFVSVLCIYIVYNVNCIFILQYI